MAQEKIVVYAFSAKIDGLAFLGVYDYPDQQDEAHAKWLSLFNDKNLGGAYMCTDEKVAAMLEVGRVGVELINH